MKKWLFVFKTQIIKKFLITKSCIHNHRAIIGVLMGKFVVKF